MSDSVKPNNQPTTPTTETTTTEPTTTVVTAPETALVSPLREDLIKSAVSFLSSANVRSAEKVKKVAFLQKKGLNQAEIDEAFKRAGDEQVSSPSTTTTTTTSYTPSPQQQQQQAPLPQQQQAPAIPSRTSNYGPPQIVYYPQPPTPPVPAEKVFALAVILGMGAVGLTAGIIGILRRFISPIFNRIATYQRSRYNQRKAIAEKLASSIKTFQTENDDLDALIDQGEENTVADALVKHQIELSSKIDQLVTFSRDRLASHLKQKTYGDFRDQLSGLKTVMNETNPYSYSSYHPGSHFNRQNNDSQAVSGLKSDIRSLKAVLLNRRNFPTV